MIRWWGPEIFTCVELDWELTPGRPWRAMMASRQFERKISRMGGVIREVETHKRIVFTFAWDENSGRDMDTVITVTFAEKNGVTMQSFHQTPFSNVAAPRQPCRRLELPHQQAATLRRKRRHRRK